MELILLAIYIITDAIRDVYSHKWFTGRTSWYRYHYVKWINFYPIAIYLFIKSFVDWYIILLIPILWWLWWAAAFLAGVEWWPFWYEWLKKRLGRRCCDKTKSR